MASLIAHVRRRSGLTVYEVRWRVGKRQRAERVGTDRRVAEEALRERQREEEAARTFTETEGGEALVASFLRAKEAERKSGGTLAFYRKHLGGLLEAWKGIPPHRWSRDLMDAYLAAHPAWSLRRVGMVVAVSRTLVRWAKSRHLYLPDFVEGLKQHGTPASTKAALTADELRRVLIASERSRYALVVHLAGCAGMYLSDCRALTWEEVDLAGGWIVRRRTKTSQPQRIPILDRLAATLERHRATHGPVVRGIGKDSSAYRQIRRIFARAGVPAGGGLRTLRIAYGTAGDLLGASRGTVGKMLGHAPDSPMTGRYIRPDDAPMLALAERMNAALS